MKTEYITKPKSEIRFMQILIAILIILALIMSFIGMKQAIDYEALECEKQELEQVVETQSSMIADLEETNYKLNNMLEGK